MFLPMCIALLVMGRREREGDMFGGIIAPHLLEHLRLGRYRSRWLNPRTLTAANLVLFTLIMMGPSWRQQPSPPPNIEAELLGA